MTLDPLIKDLYLSADLNRTENGFNHKNGSTDVIVTIEVSGCNKEKKTAKYIASFFTYDNIHTLKCRHLKTGEYLNGKYFYAKNMLLIDDYSIENVRTVVNHLIQEGEFREVFIKL